MGGRESERLRAIRDGGFLRASHRATSVAPFDNLGLPYHGGAARDLKPLEGGPVELAFDLLPTSYIFPAGHRIRVTIACADRDNARTPVLTPPPTVNVYRDASRPSYITLPVIPQKGTDADASAPPRSRPAPKRRAFPCYSFRSAAWAPPSPHSPPFTSTGVAGRFEPSRRAPARWTAQPRPTRADTPEDNSMTSDIIQHDAPRPYVELRTGIPYARLISHQTFFAEAVGERFGLDPAHVIPSAGTTGAIESVRNHVLKTSARRRPCC